MKKIKGVFNKLASKLSSTTTYKAPSSTFPKRNSNPQTRAMSKTLRANRLKNKHSSGRGVGY